MNTYQVLCFLGKVEARAKVRLTDPLRIKISQKVTAFVPLDDQSPAALFAVVHAFEEETGHVLGPGEAIRLVNSC
jgi:hypothetical protein